jgi:hypothetical protein
MHKKRLHSYSFLIEIGGDSSAKTIAFDDKSLGRNKGMCQAEKPTKIRGYGVFLIGFSEKAEGTNCKR